MDVIAQKRNKYMEVTTPDIYVLPYKEFKKAAVDPDYKKERYGRMGESVHWTGWGNWK